MAARTVMLAAAVHQYFLCSLDPTPGDRLPLDRLFCNTKSTGSLHASTYGLFRGPLFTAHRLRPDTEGYFGPCKDPMSPSGGRQHPHCKNSSSPLFLSVEVCLGAALVIICRISSQKGQFSALGEAAAAHRTPQDAAGLTLGTPKQD